MVEHYPDLSRPPFTAICGPADFVDCPPHHAARHELRQVLESRRGFGLLVGAAGSGKTALVTRLIGELPGEFGPLVRLVCPRLVTVDLLAWLAADLSADDDDPSLLRPPNPLDRLRDLLVDWNAIGRRPLIVVDEAHLVDDSRTLEALSLLWNLPNLPADACSVLLVGQPGVEGWLARVPRLARRVIRTVTLEALSIGQTADYVETRLRAAGADRPFFTPAALEAVHAVSSGLPRTIHRVCNVALVAGRALRLPIIDAAHIRSAALEIPSLTATPTWHQKGPHWHADRPEPATRRFA